MQCPRGTPCRLEDVEANLAALEVHIRVEEWRSESHFRRHEWILRWNAEGDGEDATAVWRITRSLVATINQCQVTHTCVCVHVRIHAKHTAECCVSIPSFVLNSVRVLVTSFRSVPCLVCFSLSQLSPSIHTPPRHSCWSSSHGFQLCFFERAHTHIHTYLCFT